MARSARQMKILELIAKKDINKQEELAILLQEAGFQVTQATVSRDIKDMGIIKVLAADGKHYKYTPHQVKEEKSFDKYHRLFRNAVLSIESSENIIVIRTESGGASSAAALIDRLDFEEVLGTVSGDDTILIIVSSKDKTDLIVEKFRKLLD
ncbi:MAG: arginine repressor [Clostridia bacterium]|nr:arginine repressor [Clostridia bacterium]